MSDLAEYPIVVLENDSPEQVGKIGLFDLYMPVCNTGLIFVAAVPGTLFVTGPRFTEIVLRASNLRAATTLVQMGLIRGESLAFIRQALDLTPQDIADLSGVPVSEVLDWESNGIELPFNVWTDLSARACKADGRAMPANHALCPNWRPRVIRVFPNVPCRGVSQTDPLSSVTNQGAQQSPTGSLIPGAECYPPPCC